MTTYRPPSPTPWVAAPPMRPERVGLVWGVLISTIPFYDFFLRGAYQGVGLYQAHTVNRSVLLISFLSTASLAAAFVFSFLAIFELGADYRRQKALVVLWFAMTVLATLSSITANADNMPFIIITLFMAQVMAINFGAMESWSRVFTAFGATVSVLFSVADLLALLSHDYEWGRLGGHAGPNYWGIASGSALMLCVLVRPLPLRAGIALVALITLYFAQARGSEVGVIIGGLAIGSVKLLTMPRQRAVFWAFAALSSAGALVAALGGVLAKRVFLVEDRYRGAGSAGSGRLVGWQETLNIISAHPLFGVGMRQHEQYLRSLGNAHNAYLAVTAEQGFIGLILYCTIVFGALIRAAAAGLRRPSAVQLALVGYLAFFIGIGLFEQYSVATGNSFVLIAFIVTALAWRADAREP